MNSYAWMAGYSRKSFVRQSFTNKKRNYQTQKKNKIKHIIITRCGEASFFKNQTC